MTVAVDQGDISGQDLTSPDDLIDRTGSIQYIIGLVCTEYCGRIAFRITGSTLVIQQGAQFRNGNGKVTAESVFSEKFVHRHSCGSAEKTLSPQMARSVPGIFITF